MSEELSLSLTFTDLTSWNTGKPSENCKKANIVIFKDTKWHGCWCQHLAAHSYCFLLHWEKEWLASGTSHPWKLLYTVSYNLHRMRFVCFVLFFFANQHSAIFRLLKNMISYSKYNNLALSTLLLCVEIK